jgi:hypothetical protein
VIATIGLASIIGGTIYYRQKSMEGLFRQALSFDPTSSEDRIAAVRGLGEFQSGASTAYLLEIALGENPLTSPEVREEAIKQLGRRGNQEIGIELSARLQLHEQLGMRTVLSRALQDVACNGTCVLSILHYLERICRGEPTFEDRFEDPYPEITDSIRQEQRLVIESLHKVLRKVPDVTLAKLVEVYGLASESPSAFALDLVQSLELREACPILQGDLERLTQSPMRGYRAPLAELRTALDGLNCKNQARIAP